jgi:hypothetical protein
MGNRLSFELTLLGTLERHVIIEPHGGSPWENSVKEILFVTTRPGLRPLRRLWGKSWLDSVNRAEGEWTAQSASEVCRILLQRTIYEKYLLIPAIRGVLFQEGR